ncbi:hypothetical protein LZ30DRAFT_741826 [Colletotrichum cereale]|nr:hypothetical protein LZ30DRAFT_741826 [Colletotrichum cereale]
MMEGTQDTDPEAIGLAIWAGHARMRMSITASFETLPLSVEGRPRSRKVDKAGSRQELIQLASESDSPVFSNKMKTHRHAVRACQAVATHLPATRHAEMIVTTSDWVSPGNWLVGCNQEPEIAKDLPFSQ